MIIRPPFVIAAMLALASPLDAVAAQRWEQLSPARLTSLHSGQATQPLETARWFGRGSSSRVTNTLRGAVWGLAIYGVLAATYIVHEKATCDGPDCFGEGFFWIGLIDMTPWAAATGALVGLVWPTGSN
jgi:hypothetical protein